MTPSHIGLTVRDAWSTVAPDHADHLQEGVLGQLRIVRVVEHRGGLLRQADAFVEPSQRQQAGVGRERGVGCLDLDGNGSKKS
jgi:hypothetical protein